MPKKKTELQGPEFSPSQGYLEREKRVRDALDLKEPDRIPLFLGLGYFLAGSGGVTRQELYENPEKAQEILEDLALQFQPDLVTGLFGSPEASRLLGDRMTKRPGYGSGANGSFQFDEKEFMKVDRCRHYTLGIL